MSSTPQDRPDVAELLTLLPDPAEDDPGMSPGRQALLRTALRREYGRPTPRPRRRMTLVLAPTAAACALAVTVGVATFASSDRGGETAGTEQEALPTAAQLLERAARTAARTPLEPPRDDQFIYAETTGFTHAQVMEDDGGTRLERMEAHSELWSSVDGSQRSLERGNGDSWYPPRTNPTLSEPTYRLLESLPTDPGVLLEQIYAEAERQYGEGSEDPLPRDQGAFQVIGSLLSTPLLPPETAATLYRAAADIPGVVVTGDAEDATGREGVAIAREHRGWRWEWIFDKDTTRLLGLRTVVTKTSEIGEAGTVFDAIAITRVAIVDEAGQAPQTSSGSTGA